MLKLIIEDDEGRKTVVPFARDEITIGRQDGNTIRLTERNVSRRHARLVRQNGHVLIEDLGSYNGTRINGERIQGQSEISDGDLIQIGDYDLALQSEAAASASAPAPARAPARKPQPVEEDDDASDEQEHTPPPASAPRQHSTAVIRLDQVEANRSRKVQNLEAEDAPRLVILTADLRGQEYACIRTEMRIGRTDENDITIDHRSVSGTHAKLVREDNGEWRILDMQSANGLTVNGETYAQATLKHGDIVELGHVKMRFVGAGKPVGSLNVDGSKLPLIIGIVVVLAALGGGGFYFFNKKRAPETPTTPETHASGTEPKKGPEPIKPVTPKPPPQQQATVVPDPQPTAVADTSAEKLKAARDAVGAHRFDEAVDILESIKDANGKRPADADALLDSARGELVAKKGLAKANKELEAGKLDDAAATLDGVATQAFEKELTEARAKLDTLRAAQKNPVQPATNSPAVEPKPVPAQGTAKTVDTNKVQELKAQAKEHLKARRYNEAGALLDQCIKADPSFAECHLMRGTVYAKSGDMERAALQYRAFLERAAPDDPSVPRLKQILEDYERGKSGTK